MCIPSTNSFHSLIANMLNLEEIIYFPKIENISSLFIIIPATILCIFVVSKTYVNRSIKIFIISFMNNWLGHFLMEGTYPIFSKFLEQAQWYKISGLSIGLFLILFSLYLVFYASTNNHARLTSSMFLQLGICISIIAFIEG